MTSHEGGQLTDIAPLALLYHENSKLSDFTAGYLAESVGSFASDLDRVRQSTTSAKTYPGQERIDLRSWRGIPRADSPLDQTLARRRSVRAGGKFPLPIQSIASLFYHSCGITDRIQHPDDPSITQPLRAYPSGGALYPIEIYFVAMKTAGLASGIYHYHAPDHCLEVVSHSAPKAMVEPLVLTMSGTLDAAALLVLTARWTLPLTKYGERGYRILFLDAGHLAQNLLLIATALNINACPIAGFHDDSLARALQLNPSEEPVLYVMTLG